MKHLMWCYKATTSYQALNWAFLDNLKCTQHSNHFLWHYELPSTQIHSDDSMWYLQFILLHFKRSRVALQNILLTKTSLNIQHAEMLLHDVWHLKGSNFLELECGTFHTYLKFLKLELMCNGSSRNVTEFLLLLLPKIIFIDRSQDEQGKWAKFTVQNQEWMKKVPAKM